MRKFTIGIWFLVLVIILAACNLASEEATESTLSPDTDLTPTIDVIFQLNGTLIAAEDANAPTQLPLPGLPNSLSTPITPISGTGATALPAGQCAVYTTYAGPDASFKISLREQPSRQATQVFRVPNFTPVYQIANTQEVEAEGYHWLNVIYMDSSTRYEGWIARDGYMRNGQRDLNTPTLRTANSQPCP